MVAILFFATMSFLFLSASMAALFGLQNFRMVGFTLLFLSLCFAGVLARPKFDASFLQFPALLAVILTLVAAADMGGTFSPLDYKIAFPIIALVFAPNLAHGLRKIDLAKIIWLFLSAYVLFTFVAILIGSPLVEQRGYGDFIRIDPSGSIVTHSSLCLIYIALTFSYFSDQKSSSKRLLLTAVGIMAAHMLLATATRTPIVTLFIFAVLASLSQPNWRRNFSRIAAILLGTTAVFASYSVFVSNSFWLRIASSEQDDYSSGRLHSIYHWLEIAASEPLGIGAGGVRDLLEEGRPYLNGTELLEWPHNEFVRLYVEAGPLGLALVTLLTGYLVSRAVAAAQTEGLTHRGVLVLIIASDMIAQCLLQNYFNTIYHATILVMILAVISVRIAIERESETRDAGKLSQTSRANRSQARSAF